MAIVKTKVELGEISSRDQSKAPEKIKLEEMQVGDKWELTPDEGYEIVYMRNFVSRHNNKTGSKIVVSYDKENGSIFLICHVASMSKYERVRSPKKNEFVNNTAMSIPRTSIKPDDVGKSVCPNCGEFMPCSKSTGWGPCEIETVIQDKLREENLTELPWKD